MPKAILQFNLPEETYEFEAAINGGKYLSALEDTDNYLRGILKHETLTDEEINLYERFRKQLREFWHG